ncbi:MAG TPA: hypothetical protein ACQGQH_02590 [Xylella sp.]
MPFQKPRQASPHPQHIMLFLLDQRSYQAVSDQHMIEIATADTFT